MAVDSPDTMEQIKTTRKEEVKQCMSRRGYSNVEAIMPKISAQVAERTKKINFHIDLSTAENCLIRPEIVQIYKTAIQEDLCSSVRLAEKDIDSESSLTAAASVLS
jgi:spore cortex formation protein SpoVR/YcgB (stage V sporulation)